MKIMITGSRNTPETDYQKLAEAIKRHAPEATEILHGGAIGADQLAKKYATLNGLKETEIKPDYKRYGRPAPLIRNNQLIEKADKVIAWHAEKKTSRGTAYTVKMATRKRKMLAEYRAGKLNESMQLPLL